MQHSDKNTYCNIRLKTFFQNACNITLKTLAKIYNMCIIPIYFCNIYSKQLQHTSETSETLETYICNIGKGKAGAGQFRASMWDPAESDGARAPPAPAAARDNTSTTTIQHQQHRP
jgi:hypothetical protein